jgi:hypothetical protein
MAEAVAALAGKSRCHGISSMTALGKSRERKKIEETFRWDRIRKRPWKRTCVGQLGTRVVTRSRRL